jgi:hypothetical protein
VREPVLWLAVGRDDSRAIDAGRSAGGFARGDCSRRGQGQQGGRDDEGGQEAVAVLIHLRSFTDIGVGQSFGGMSGDGKSRRQGLPRDGTRSISDH